jgi:Flp pilus assembly protein TadG
MIAFFRNLALSGATCRRGMATTEFALLLPVLTTLLFGVVELSDALTVNRRVAIAANSMADLTAQSPYVTYADVDNLIDGVKSIIDLPNDESGMEVNLISIVLEDGDPVVHWSRNQDGAEPYAEGSDYTNLNDNAVLNENGSLIVVEMTQPYAPRLTRYFVGDAITFEHRSVRWPRVASKVQLCQAVATNCTT